MMKLFILRHLMAVILTISIFACVPAVSDAPRGSLQPDVGPVRMDNNYYYYTEAQLALKKGRADHAYHVNVLPFDKLNAAVASQKDAGSLRNQSW